MNLWKIDAKLVEVLSKILLNPWFVWEKWIENRRGDDTWYSKPLTVVRTALGRTGLPIHQNGSSALSLDTQFQELQLLHPRSSMDGCNANQRKTAKNSLKLTASLPPWKLMVGRCFSFWEPAYFPRVSLAVSFQGEKLNGFFRPSCDVGMIQLQQSIHLEAYDVCFFFIIIIIIIIIRDTLARFLVGRICQSSK